MKFHGQVACSNGYGRNLLQQDDEATRRQLCAAGDAVSPRHRRLRLRHRDRPRCRRRRRRWEFIDIRKVLDVSAEASGETTAASRDDDSELPVALVEATLSADGGGLIDATGVEEAAVTTARGCSCYRGGQRHGT